MKKAIMITYLILFFLILATCAQKVDDQHQVTPITTEEVDLVKAKQIIDTGCLVCHSATASEDNRLAPPLEAVKRRYLMDYPKIEDFTAAVVDFVAEPTEEKAIMYGAVQRFDVMLPMAYSDKDLQAVATYIYQYELERPDWFEEHYQEMHGEKGMGKGAGKHQRQQHRRGQGGS